MRPKSAEELTAIRTSGRMLATILDYIQQNLQAGMTGLDIDQIARRELKKLGGEPAFLGVPGGPRVPDFPSTICISIDDAVVHGLPDAVPYRKGQIIGFDFGVIYNGMITDAARTLVVGGEYRTPRERELVEATLHALNAGIQAVRAGATTGDIAAAVQFVLDKHHLGIVRDLVGHGVGHELHEPPEIPNYGKRHTGSELRTGMTIAIEPMATLGEWRVVVDPDKWTIRTRDGSLAAHFEDTILVTDNGFEILTRL